MPKISELLTLHDELAQDSGWKSVLGDPFLIQNCRAYKNFRLWQEADASVRVLPSLQGPQLGWPFWRIHHSLDPNSIFYFDNATSLKSVLTAMGSHDQQFTLSTYNYKDILGNTVLIEYLMIRMDRFFKDNKISLELPQRQLLKWIFGFTAEMWIGLHCHSAISQWFCTVNLYFRNLGHINKFTDRVEVTSFEDFFELHIYEFVKMIYRHFEGGSADVSNLSQKAVSISDGALFAITNLILKMTPLSQKSVKVALEDLIEVTDSADFRNQFGLPA